MSLETESSESALHAMDVIIDELPLLPQVLVRILQLNSNSEDYFEQFELLAREDPALAIRVVALANSAASAPVSPIVSIKDALTRMGATTIRNLVTSIAVQRVFLPSKPNQIRLWRHSIITAVAMENIAKLIPDLDVDPGSAYLVGLLHDIGRFVMFEHATSDLQIVDESDWQSPEALLEAEKGVFGYAHSELGGLACKHWGLPDAITQAVRRHHTFIEGEIKPSSSEAVLCINQIADRLSISVLESPDGGELNREQLACRIDQQCLQPIQIPLNFSANVLVENIDSIRSQSDQILSGLGFA